MSELRIFVLLTIALFAFMASADESLRDPTRPYDVELAPTTRAPGFRVSAIFLSDQRRVAILNGHAVTVGDRVDGATVTRIGERTVQLSFRGRTLSATLKTARIRQ